MKKSTIRIVGCFIIFAGLAGILIARIATPQFAARYLSPDHHVDPSGIQTLTTLRLIIQILSASLIFGGMLLLLAPTFSTSFGEKLSKVFASKHLILVAAIGMWAILYLTYVLTHDIPVNPGGFYLESALQLIHNGFRIPKYVEGFGEDGIPFAYPPLGIYLYGVAGYILGSVHKAALYIPGILLPLQAIAAYSFMKQWSNSEQASQWTAVIMLLMPQLFYRTMYGDGLTTGLASVFLWLSWRFAILSDRPGFYQSPVMGGLFVGCSVLSHPAIGLFAAVTFTILYLSRTGFNIKAITGLVLSGISAFAVTLPWLLTVITVHGFEPILASLQDSKSPLSMSYGIKDTLSYMLDEHTVEPEESIAFLLVPPAILYVILRGPRIILLLLVAGLLTFKGHPSVSMFAFAISIGVFYSNFLFPAMGRWRPWVDRQSDEHNTSDGVRSPLLFGGVHLAAMFLLCLRFVVTPAFSPGEKATYDWIKANTESNSTFLMEGIEENLVYFGRRQILLPVLGAEWMPSPEYGNAHERNKFVREEIFACRQPECLSSSFEKYQVTPDYVIYRISSDEEQAWIEELSASPMFDIALASEPLITLSYYK